MVNDAWRCSYNFAPLCCVDCCIPNIYCMCVCITASLGCHLKIEFNEGRDVLSFPTTPTLEDLVQSYPALHDALRFGHYDQSSGASMSTS